MTHIDPKSLRDNMIKAGLSDGHFKMMGLDPPEEVWEDMQTTSMNWSSEPVVYFKFKPEHPMHRVTNGKILRYTRKETRYDDTGEALSREVMVELIPRNLLIRVPRRR
jgi:hypothetical protein